MGDEEDSFGDVAHTTVSVREDSVRRRKTVVVDAEEENRRPTVAVCVTDDGARVVLGGRWWVEPGPLPRSGAYTQIRRRPLSDRKENFIKSSHYPSR